MELFHLTQNRLAPSSVVLPGNYGRILQSVGWRHTASFREAILEAVRIQNFPHLPSRLTCIFCFNCKNDAAVFKAENEGFQYSVLHRVSINPDTTMIHETDWRWINPDAVSVVFPDITWAAQYWNGLPKRHSAIGQGDSIINSSSPITAEVAVRSSERREVLVGGPVTIEECLDLV